jgi:hypothetical protein
MKSAGRFSVVLVLAATILALTACGGGGGGGAAPAVPVVTAAPTAPVVPGSETGMLVDSPVGGVSYATSSGVTGTTAADGSYKFNPGDTVTFKIGGVTLGTTNANGIISPMELSSGSAVKLQNLLVLMQSLDSDGDPANGITIPAAAALALPASVDLATATATFASSANTGLQAAMTAGAISGAIKTTAAANEHFKTQGLSLLASNIWVQQSTDSGGQTHTVVLRLDSTGSYLQIEAGSTEYANGPLQPATSATGLEVGRVQVSGVTPSGFSLTSTVALDANGRWGLSSLKPCETFRSVGALLMTSDCAGGSATLRPMDNSTSGLVGAYFYASSTITEFYFFANGTFVLADYPTQYCTADCEPTVQHGHYDFAANTLVLNPVDGEPVTFQLELTQSRLNFNLSGNGFSGAFTRISR